MRNYKQDIHKICSTRLKGIVESPDATAEELLRHFSTLQLPERKKENSENAVFDYISIHSIHSSAASYKPGNLTLSWRRLSEKLPEVILTAAGFTSPYIAIVSALHIWTIFNGLAKIDLRPEHSTIFYALTMHKPFRCEFSESEVIELTNQTRMQHNLPPLESAAISRLLDELSDFKCIKIKNGRVFVIEEVRIPLAA